MLSEGPTDYINENVGEPKKKNFSINFTDPKTKLCSSLYYNKEYNFVNLRHLMIYLLSLYVYEV